MKHLLILYLLTTTAVFSYGQFGAGKKALNQIEKGRWRDAEQTIRRDLRKNARNIETNYIFSWYFSAQENPNRNVDSAFHYVTLAMQSFSQTPIKEKAKLKRFPIDSTVLALQQQKIDSMAFERAKKINTGQGYIDFLDKFVSSPERGVAIELRDEVAFLDAMKINSAEGFNEYLDHHFGSLRYDEAMQRYNKLLYRDRTADGKLKSYERFYIEFPESPFREDAGRNIFEISTASGRVLSLQRFIEKFPSSKWQRSAAALLYHLKKEDEYEISGLSDSLKRVQLKENGYWVPVTKNGKYGFIDHHGVEMIAPVFDSIPNEYRCGNIRSDFLKVAGGIVNRDGSWIIKGKIDDVLDIGAGFLKIRSGDCYRSVHKSGLLTTAECYQDVKLIGRNFLAVRDNGKWGLVSFSNRLLLSPQYDDIIAMDTLVILSGNGKKYPATLTQISARAEGNAFKPSLAFDDIRRLSNGHYLVKNGTLEGVLNGDLEFMLAMDRYQISITSTGFILGRDGKVSVTGLEGVPPRLEFDDIQFYGRWVKLRLGKELQLYNLDRKMIQVQLADSLWFKNQLAFARIKDSVKVYINSIATVSFPFDEKVSFIKSIDSSKFLFITARKKNRVFDAVTGKRLFIQPFDAIEYIGHNCFVITRYGKKGIVYRDGRILLPVEYDAIVKASANWFSLLRNKKFGCYDVVSRWLIKAAYDRNIKPFSKRMLIACKQGAFGFIDVDDRAQSHFEFAEIRQWNDTSALIKKDFQWMIYSIRSRKIGIHDIREYHYVRESAEENVAIVRRTNSYGVLSNRRGEVIPASYSEIINVGSPEEPLYFTDKNVEEAGIHVVIYYDKTGKILRKQALDDEEFDRIRCEEN